MHEWALAEAVIAAASQIAEEEGLREVTEVKLKVGELQNLELDLLDFAFSQLKPEKFKNAKLSVEMEKAEFKCRVCGNTWFFKRNELDSSTSEAIHFLPETAHTYIKCPKCGSPDFEILHGRGVLLESIRGVK
ncbi:MAG: hydrogenase nickel incorporation protein HypA [Candidatus Bathyarchaeales archaeon]